MIRALLALLDIGQPGREFAATRAEFEAGQRRGRVVASSYGNTRRRMIAETEKEMAERPAVFEAGFRKAMREHGGRR